MTAIQPGTQRPSALHVEPSARTYTLANLVTLVREGRVRVPHFQRRLRWGTPDAVALIDSVLRGFPIGSLLMWKRPGPAEQITLGGLTIAAPKLDEALYVVDGQQRVTTFSNVFDPVAGGKPPFQLVYDLSEQPFRVRAARAHERASIPLPTLFDLNLLLRWTRENAEYVDQIDEINQATTRLREFHVPAYEVRSDDDEALRDIYDRMNNAGKRLSRAEAFWGLHAPDAVTARTATTLTTLQEHVATALHWGHIDDDTILRVFLARRGHDVARDIHQEFDDERRERNDFPGETMETAHTEALAALERTVTFLKVEAGVPHFTFLAYRYLLIVLSRFFAHFPDPGPRNVELLRRWYWRAALAGPIVAKGSTTGVLRTLAACIRPGEESASVQALLAATPETDLHRPDPTRFRTNHASGHIMLCALWQRGPLSPDSGEPFTDTDLATALDSASSPGAAVPELFPRARLRPENSAAVGNRLILPGMPVELVRDLAEGDDLFTRDDAPDVRESHFLPGLNDSGAMVSPDVLVEQRTQLIADDLANFLSLKAGLGFESTPPLADLDLDDDEDPSDAWTD